MINLTRKTLALAGVSVMALFAQRASAITFTFQENDVPANTSTTLGTSSTFTEGAFSIIASGYLKPGTASALFAKFTSGNPGETGLGMVTDLGGDHEIDINHFIQLDLSSLKNASAGKISLGSIQSGESGKVYATLTPGSLVGATLINTLTANGDLDITSYVNAGDFIDITAGSNNVLITSLTVSIPNTRQIPDGGSTAILLGAALSAFGLVRRKLTA